MKRFLATTSLVLVLTACAAESSLNTEDEWWGDTAIFDSGIPDEDTDSDGVDDTGDANPTYWSVSGTLAVRDGLVAKADTDLAIAIIGDDRVEDPPLCESEPVLVGAQPATLPNNSLELWGWWSLTFAGGLPDCSPSSFQTSHTTLNLGLGALDPLLFPALDAEGIEYASANQTLYGLYAQEVDEGPVYIFGIAGTTGNLAGTDGTVSGGPLPDGDYEVQTLHFLPL